MAGRSREDKEADRNGMPMAKSEGREGLPKHEGGKFEDSMKHMHGGKGGGKKGGRKGGGRKASRK